MKITESQLKQIITESVKKILKEFSHNPHTINIDRDSEFANSDEYNAAKQHNSMWDGEEEEIYPDINGMRTFKPSEDWEKDSNEDNFMGGQSEDENGLASLKEYVGQEIIQAANAITKHCEYVTSRISKGREDRENYFAGRTAFVVDDDNCAYVIINPGTYYDIEITMKTYRGLFGTQYTIDVPEGAEEGAQHAMGYGILSYNVNKKESKRLYINLIRAILNNSLYKKEYNFERYTDLIPDDPAVKEAMMNSYRALVKTHKTLLKLYGGKEIETPKDSPWETEFSRQWQRKAY